MGFLSKIRKGIKKQVAQMPRGIVRDMGPGNIPRRSGGLFRGLPMAKPIMGDMRFRGSMPSIIEGRAERLPTAPSGIAGLMNRLPQKNTAFSEAVRKLKEQIRNQQMPQPMPGAMPQVDMQNIPQIPTRESIQDYVRENIDLSNLQSRMPNFQMFQEGGMVGLGNIPGLNLDFSKLPKNIDLRNLDPRAISADPQGFQDMIERARAQEELQGSLPVENSMGMVGTLGGPGYGEYPLGTAGPRVDPSDPNYVPPGSAGRTPGFYVGGFEGPLLGPKRDAGAMFPPAPKSYIDVDGNLRFGDMPITTMPVGPRGPGMSIEDLLERVTTMPVEEPEPAPVMPRISMPGLPDFNFNTSNIPAPESFSESPYFMPGSGMGRIGQGVATDRESLIGKKIFGQTITPESFAGRETAKSPFFSAVPRPDLPTPNISGPFGFINKSAPAPVMPEPNSFFPGVMPELPDFSNMDFSSLRNFNSR